MYSEGFSPALAAFSLIIKYSFPENRIVFLFSLLIVIAGLPGFFFVFFTVSIILILSVFCISLCDQREHRASVFLAFDSFCPTKTPLAFKSKQSSRVAGRPRIVAQLKNDPKPGRPDIAAEIIKIYSIPDLSGAFFLAGVLLSFCFSMLKIFVLFIPNSRILFFNSIHNWI